MYRKGGRCEKRDRKKVDTCGGAWDIYARASNQERNDCLDQRAATR